MLFTSKYFAKKEPTYSLLTKNSSPQKNFKFVFFDYVNDDQLKPN